MITIKVNAPATVQVTVQSSPELAHFVKTVISAAFRYSVAFTGGNRVRLYHSPGATDQVNREELRGLVYALSEAGFTPPNLYEDAAFTKSVAHGCGGDVAVTEFSLR
jgi:hypothetical protein